MCCLRWFFHVKHEDDADWVNSDRDRWNLTEGTSKADFVGHFQGGWVKFAQGCTISNKWRTDVKKETGYPRFT